MKLMEYLPAFYGNSSEVATLQAALDPQAQALRDAVQDLLAQLNVSSATWGLSLWEGALGLSTEAAKDTDYRRTRVISKLRGHGSTTAALVEAVAASFSNGDVDVIQYPEESRFEVKFTGTIGIPPNLDDLKAAIEEIKPAHLACSYIIIYRTWSMIGTKTWGELASKTWDDVKEGNIA